MEIFRFTDAFTMLVLQNFSYSLKYFPDFTPTYCCFECRLRPLFKISYRNDLLNQSSCFLGMRLSASKWLSQGHHRDCSWLVSNQQSSASSTVQLHAPLKLILNYCTAHCGLLRKMQTVTFLRWFNIMRCWTNMHISCYQVGLDEVENWTNLFSLWWSLLPPALL